MNGCWQCRHQTRSLRVPCSVVTQCCRGCGETYYLALAEPHPACQGVLTFTHASGARVTVSDDVDDRTLWQMGAARA